MIDNLANKLDPEEKRIKVLEQSIADYREFYTSDSFWAKANIFVKHQFRPFYFVDTPGWRISLRKRDLENRVPPDFCSTGAVRSGTSALSNYIFQHPCVALPLAKELSLARYDYDHLRAQFPLKSEIESLHKTYGAAITGHSSPFSPSSNMIYFNKKLNPKMKTVVILRDPVTRVISQWRWDVMRMQGMRSDPLWKHMPNFEESMRVEMKEINSGGCGFQLSSGSGGTSYLRHSIYLPFIELLVEQMGLKNVCIINAEEFFSNPEKIAAEVYEFLDLPPYSPIEIKEKNHSFDLNVSQEIREELAFFFKEHNERLYEFLGKDQGW